MFSDTLIAKKYSHLFIASVTDSAKLPLYVDEFKDTIRSICSDNKIAKILFSRFVSVKYKFLFFNEAVKDLTISGFMREFFHLLIKKNRMNIVSHIDAYLEKFLRTKENRQFVEVTLSSQYSDEEIRSLEDSIRKIFNSPLDFCYKIDPLIQGGVILKIEDKILDLSLSSKLKQLLKNLRSEQNI